MILSSLPWPTGKTSPKHSTGKIKRFTQESPWKSCLWLTELYRLFSYRWNDSFSSFCSFNKYLAVITNFPPQVQQVIWPFNTKKFYTFWHTMKNDYSAYPGINSDLMTHQKCLKSDFVFHFSTYGNINSSKICKVHKLAITWKQLLISLNLTPSRKTTWCT
jgi:hypothetical protein